MAQLAIRGHATRGREVIELLEMLGGKNICHHNGNSDVGLYFIDDDKDIVLYEGLASDSVYVSYTLEEFLEKFPYKVGDKVLYKLYNVYSSIRKMTWNEEKEQVIYRLDSQKIWVATTDELQPYKEETTMEEKRIPPYMDYDVRTEETMEGKLISKEEMSLKIDTSSMEKRRIVFNTDSPSETELVLGDDYEIKVEDDKTYVVRKKPQYPKTYKECCEVLGLNTMDNDAQGYKADLIIRFQELLIARDAYWKIAGEEIGLGESWECDWFEGCQIKYCIGNCGGRVDKIISTIIGNPFAFPTEEMRDAFYENFKDLIEECKELL